MKKLLLHFLQVQKFALQALAILLVCSGSVLADNSEGRLLQADVTVKGKILDDTGSPLPGASIIEKGTSNGTITDINGAYTLSVSDQATLIISFIGFKTIELPVNGRNVIDVELEGDFAQLEEVVVIGYGTQKKSDLTGSISSITGENIEAMQVGDPSQLLMGRATGVRVEAVGGSPGAPTNIVVRGVSSLSNSNPLFVIDGMFTDNMDFLNPSDIKSIDVLKDASAAAIYGSRAANGVIIITTNDGKAVDGIQVDFEASVGTQSQINKLDWLTGAEFADLRNTLAINNAPEGEEPLLFPGFNENLDRSVNTIIDDIAIRDAPVTNMQLTLRGGSDVVNYNISANWMDQEGIIVASDFDRKTFRTNLNINKGRFKLTESFTVSRTFRRINPIWNLGNNIIPSIPFLNSDNLGGYNAATLAEHGFDGNNRVGKSLLWDRYLRNDNLLTNINASYELAEGLTLNANLGVQYASNLNYNFEPAFYMSDNQRASLDESQLRDATTNLLNLLGEGTINYKRAFGKNSLEALGGFTLQETTTNTGRTWVSGFPSDDIRQVSAASNIVQVTGTETVNSLASLFGRVNYNYDGKYFLTATLRRDGSSRFPEDNRFGVFPSIGVGYTLSKEEFLQGSPVVSNLKFRASYGELGSQNIGDYAYIPVLNINSDGVFGTGQNRNTGVSQTVFANPNLVWETTKTYDIGLDAAFFDYKLSFTADYFNKESQDVLVALNIPRTSGTTEAVAQNAASIRNSGFEFGANYNNNIGELELSIGGNITFLSNEVLSLGENIAPITAGPASTSIITRTDEGGEVGAYYGFEVDGIYRDQADLDADIAAGLTVPNAGLGDFIYRDIDGNGVLDEDDQTSIGSYIPDYDYGIVIDGKYKNFDFNLIFNGVQGVEIYNFRKGDQLLANSTGNKLRAALDYWTPENPDASLPRVGGGANNGRPSSFFVEDGSYFRLRNIQIGYSLPSAVINKLKLRKVRIYASVQNLFTFSDYSGYYPEIGRSFLEEDLVVDNTNLLFFAGVDQGAYPTPRTFLMGLQIGF